MEHKHSVIFRKSHYYVYEILATLFLVLVTSCSEYQLKRKTINDFVRYLNDNGINAQLGEPVYFGSSSIDYLMKGNYISMDHGIVELYKHSYDDIELFQVVMFYAASLPTFSPDRRRIENGWMESHPPFLLMQRKDFFFRGPEPWEKAIIDKFEIWCR